MKRTVHTCTSDGPRGLAGVSARLRARLDQRLERRGESGSILIEALIFMAVIAITMGAYTAVNMQVNDVQRDQTALDIVAQQGQGVLQSSQSVPWSMLGSNLQTSSQPEQCAHIDVNGQPAPTVTTPTAAPEEFEDLQPLTEDLTRGNVTITRQVTCITWESCGKQTSGLLVVCKTAMNPASYGTKRVTVFLDYLVTGDERVHSERYTMLRTATANEASPYTQCALPNAAVDAEPVTCPLTPETPEA